VDGKRRALIVSADTYGDAKLRRLRMPAVDAAALRRVLEDPEVAGFEVDVSLNEPHHVVRGKIEDFFKAAAVDDFLLLHFGCHGVKDDDGKLYLVASDTAMARLDSSGIDAEFVNRHMARSRSRRIVLLLDCCYSGAFARGSPTRAAGGIDIGERFKQGRGRLVLTASTAMEYAWDGDELNNLGDAGPSSFTAAVVRGLETGEADLDHDGQVSFRDLSDYVYDFVRAQNPKQTPQKWYLESEGDLYIARTPPLARQARRGAPRRRNYALLQPQLELVLEDEVFSVAIAPGNRLLAAGSDAVIALWRGDTEIATWRDAPQPELVTDVHNAFVYAVAFSPDGRRLATCGEDGVVHVRDLERGRLWSQRHHTEAAYSVAFSPDGASVASGGYDREVRILDAETGAVRRGLGCSHRVSSVAFSPDARVLVIGSLDNTITVWELGTGDSHVLPHKHQSSVERVSFSPDGRRLASCGLDKAVRVWDATSWQPLWANATEHGYLVRSVAFAPDGATLASASWDKTVKLWNSENGQPTGLPWQAGRPRHTDWIWSVAFSPDGRVLASAGSDSKVILWMLSDTD
jgi:WD40 repeat protein